MAGVEQKVGSDGEGIAEPGVVHCLERWLGFCGSWQSRACRSRAARNCGSFQLEEEEDIIIRIRKWRRQRRRIRRKWKQYAAILYRRCTWFEDLSHCRLSYEPLLHRLCHGASCYRKALSLQVWRCLIVLLWCVLPWLINIIYIYSFGA